MKCFYAPGATCIIDTINPETDRSSIGNESLADIQKRYPLAEIWNLDEASKEIQTRLYASTISAPAEITAERWDELLNILPPMKWRGGEHSESFMISEATVINLHCILCRIGERYFELTDRRSLSHEEIVAKCMEFMPAINSGEIS